MKTKVFLLASLICLLLCTSSCTSYIYEYDTRPATTYYYSNGVRVYRSLGNVYDSHHHHYHHYHKPAHVHRTHKHEPSNYRPSTNRPTRPSSSSHHKTSPGRR